MKKAFKTKRLWFVIATIVISLLCAVCFVACDSGIGEKGGENDKDTHTHSYVNYTYNNDATCVADGTDTAKCEYCEETDTRVKANTATGVHSFVSYTYNNDATCVDDGTETAKCQNCEESDTRTKANTATGEHSYVDYVCTVCGGYSQDFPVTERRLDYVEIRENNEIVGYSVAGRGNVGAFVTDIFIPQSYNGKPVMSIGESAFRGCVGLTSITIGDSVTSIAERAFFDCSGLTSITIGGNVTSIGNSAFYNCSGLTGIEIPNSVTSIGDHAFRGCVGLTSIEIPNSVTSIGESAFYGCSGLTSIKIPNSVTSIEESTFYNCNSLASIEIPNSVTDIGEMAFFGCRDLISIAVQDGNIKYHSKNNCLIDTNNKILILGCKSSIIPDDGSVIDIGDNAFYGCSGLASIDIPNYVTGIGAYAFSLCGGLTSIEIPNSITRIENFAFAQSNSLTIYCEMASQPNNWRENWNFNRYPVIWDCKHNDKDINGFEYAVIDGLRYSFKDDVAKVEAQSTHLSGDIVIPTNVTYKGSSYSVISINHWAFGECESITSIKLPNGITNIGSLAFSNCDSLTSVIIPNSVMNIEDSAFYRCSTLTSVRFNGTTEQWAAISKAASWNVFSLIKTIVCDDGTITL
ncbi:MAG: leucine-rich repeat domain-containing protein [Clostridiales bacterium]|nr:leucine-rich repeat domain-containing protein [Clostridiales bacterium]